MKPLPSGQFVWLSQECLRLGKINLQNGDDAEYVLISEDFHLAIDAAEAARVEFNVEYIRAEKPHVWLGVYGKIFRFFVFEVSLEDGATEIKILTDARVEELPR
jgi:hypothetical protein